VIGRIAGFGRALHALVVLLSCACVASARADETKKDEFLEPVKECISCHGPLGRPGDPNIPIIGAQNREYLYRALQAYKNGGRADGGDALVKAMIDVARKYDDAQLEAAADFFSRLEPVR
jgi:cytochrome c553